MQTGELRISTHRRCQMVPVTDKVAALVRERGWRDGVLTLFVPHTTAGITINENADPDVARDMECYFERLVPENLGFRHAEGNSDAHIKATLAGISLQVIVCSGLLRLGTWQGIYLCEFDGPRERQLQLAFTS